MILWSGNQIGHGTRIRDNCFLSSHAAISGECIVGENCFIGINSTFSDHLTIAKDCIIGAAANLIKNTDEAGIYVGNPAKRMEKSSLDTVFWISEKNED